MAQKIQVLIVRHGDVSPERDAQKNQHLSPKGERQARALVEFWQEVHSTPLLALASPATQVQETVARACPGIPTQFKEELHYGTQGTQRDILVKEYLAHRGKEPTLHDFLQSDARATLLAWADRARQCVLELGVIRLRSETEGSASLAVFTHGILAQALVHAFVSTRGEYKVNFPPNYMTDVVAPGEWIQVDLLFP